MCNIQVLQNLQMEHNKLIVSKSFFGINPIVIGVDMGCSFVMELVNGNILPITEDNAVNLLRLLEIEYHAFCQELEKLLSNLKTIKRDVQINVDNFPSNLIVKAALNSERDYWVELSIPWLKEIGKSNFIKEINTIQKSKRVSQRVRHLLLKL